MREKVELLNEEEVRETRRLLSSTVSLALDFFLTFSCQSCFASLFDSLSSNVSCQSLQLRQSLVELLFLFSFELSCQSLALASTVSSRTTTLSNKGTSKYVGRQRTLQTILRNSLLLEIQLERSFVTESSGPIKCKAKLFVHVLSKFDSGPQGKFRCDQRPNNPQITLSLDTNRYLVRGFVHVYSELQNTYILSN